MGDQVGAYVPISGPRRIWQRQGPQVQPLNLSPVENFWLKQVFDSPLTEQRHGGYVCAFW